MKIGVLFFAQLQEGLGETAEMDLPEGATVADLRRGLRLERFGLDQLPISFALNMRLCPEETRLSSGDVVACLPPFAGGA